MMEVLYGMGLCVALCVIFVLFVRMKGEGEGEGGCGGGSCGSCHSAGTCSIAEKHNEH